MDVFAVIPARGGSTRVSKKNIRDVGGKPLIAHTIEQATAAETIDRCIVSTDDDEIADVARTHGGDVPFERPAELATDEATSPPVIKHALDWVEDCGESPEIVVMLQVTAPLRTPADIDGAIEKLYTRPDATSIVSVTEFDTPPYWAMEMSDTDVLDAHFDRDVFWTNEIPRSQVLPTFYYPNGAVFAARTAVFRETVNFYTETTLGYEMPPERSVDIDEPYELELVRALMELRKD